MRLASSNVALDIDTPKLGTAPMEAVLATALDIAAEYASESAWFWEND
jgi:hypothetical protein